MGPGVTPDVMWQGDAPGAYDKTLDAAGEPRDRATRRQASAAANCRSGRSARLDPVQDRGAEQRALFRRWPAGVSVVVAEVGRAQAGLTVSSLVSLSLEPPLVGISLALDGVALRGAA